MSAQRYSAEKQFRQRMGVAKKIEVMPRFQYLAPRKKGWFNYANARYAHKFEKHRHAVSLYAKAIILDPLNIKIFFLMFCILSEISIKKCSNYANYILKHK